MDKDDVKTFVVTAEWVHENATPDGGWTKRQLDILGVKWPPAKGWIKKLVGTRISERQRQWFEAEARCDLFRGT